MLHLLFESASPRRELKIFTEREGGAQHASFDHSINAGHYIADRVEGGAQHASFDHSINAGHYIADRVAETLGGRTAA